MSLLSLSADEQKLAQTEGRLYLTVCKVSDEIQKFLVAIPIGSID